MENIDQNEKMESFSQGTWKKETKQEYLTRQAKKITVRFLIFFSVSLVFSVVMRGLIYVGFFNLLSGTSADVAFNFLGQFAILLAYWYFILVFARKCRHRSRSPKHLRRSNFIVYGLYAAISLIGYYTIPRAVYVWLFRMPLAFSGLLRLPTTTEHLPYLLLFHLITFLILMLEPAIDYGIYRFYEHRRRKM